MKLEIVDFGFLDIHFLVSLKFSFLLKNNAISIITFGCFSKLDCQNNLLYERL
jgi:hypothetical protein